MSFLKEFPQPTGSFDVDLYKPPCQKKAVFIEKLPIPKREFKKGEPGRCVVIISPRGVIILNIIYEGFPVVCQAQYSLKSPGIYPPEDPESYNLFMVHQPPTEEDYTEIHIPEELVMEVIDGLLPLLLGDLKEKDRLLGPGELLIEKEDGKKELIYLN